MSRKKVLLLVTLSEIGGAQKVVYHLAAGLDREKFDITVACAPGGELVEWVKDLPGVKVVELACLRRDISPLQDALCLLRLYRLIKSGGYDIVHCHSSKAGVLGRLAARLAGVRQIYFTVHGWGIDNRQPLPVRWLYAMAERLAGAVSTGVVCVSDHDRKKGLTLRLAGEDKLAVIHNGMPDVSGLRRIPENGLRKELGLKAGDVIIGTVMRLAPPKQPLFFLETAATLMERACHAGLYFVIVGDGPLRSRCEEYIAEHNLRGRAFLLGTREDSQVLVSGLDIFTLFSSHEGLPLTIIEAMLAGLPVVAGNVGGVGEMVVHGETGYLVNGADVEAAASCIEELVKNPHLRGKMGAAGRRRALEMFTLDRMISHYEELYLGRL
ncbi:MAG: glycosyltransferase family 4 protein [Peptococcaceae bacterium]|nr:glycosyltransferase family 4 protein [Peptococcaceae bacterium]